MHPRNHTRDVLSGTVMALRQLVSELPDAVKVPKIDVADHVPPVSLDVGDAERVRLDAQQDKLTQDMLALEVRTFYFPLSSDPHSGRLLV